MTPRRRSPSGRRRDHTVDFAKAPAGPGAVNAGGFRATAGLAGPPTLSGCLKAPRHGSRARSHPPAASYQATASPGRASRATQARAPRIKTPISKWQRLVLVVGLVVSMGLALLLPWEVRHQGGTEIVRAFVFSPENSLRRSAPYV